jgi:hypothetical protein
MNASTISSYLQNTFWLLIPILAFNIIFMKNLPHVYQRNVFWKNVPAWVGVPENLFRLPIFLLPLIMRFEVSSPSQKLGFWLYAVGTLLYFAAWGMQISFPRSTWSKSTGGFMAPAYTPILWLTGIGLIGDSLTIQGIPYKSYLYFCLVGVFLVFHNLHTWIIRVRQSKIKFS